MDQGDGCALSVLGIEGPAIPRSARDETGNIGVSLETLAYLILKARAFDAQADVSDPNESSNPADDRAVPVLEGQSDDPTQAELRAAIEGLPEEEQTTLVALAWMARGDFEAEEWETALTTANERRRGSTAHYLMGMPTLGDFLEEGAAMLGVSLTDEETAVLEHGVGRRSSDRDCAARSRGLVELGGCLGVDRPKFSGRALHHPVAGLGAQWTFQGLNDRGMRQHKIAAPDLGAFFVRAVVSLAVGLLKR